MTNNKKVEQLTAQIESVRAYLQNILDLGVIDAVRPEAAEIAKEALKALEVE
jgi:hypothetical protein